MLVSGDVYDRAMPSPDTVELLSQSAASGSSTPVPRSCVSSGNHDSAIRLGFASGAARARRRCTCARRVADVGRPVLLGDTAVHPLPYLEPALAADALGATERTHAGVLRAAMDAGAGRRRAARRAHRRHGPRLRHRRGHERVRARHQRRRRVRRAAARCSPASTTPPWATSTAARRSRPASATAAPRVAMSFSEWHAPQGQPARRPLRRHPGGRARRGSGRSGRSPCCAAPSTTLLADPAHHGAESAWCQVTLTDPQRPLGAMDQVRRRFPHTLELRFDPQGATVPLRPYAARVATAHRRRGLLRLPRTRARRARCQRRRAGPARRGRRGQPGGPPGRRRRGRSPRRRRVAGAA